MTCAASGQIVRNSRVRIGLLVVVFVMVMMVVMMDQERSRVCQGDLYAERVGQSVTSRIDHYCVNAYRGIFVE